MKFSLKTISYISLLAICWVAGVSYAGYLTIKVPSSFQITQPGIAVSPGISAFWYGPSYSIWAFPPKLPSGSYAKIYFTLQSGNSVCIVPGVFLSVVNVPDTSHYSNNVSLTPKSTSGSLAPSSTCPYKSYSMQFSAPDSYYYYTATFSFK